jgi:hypothetical protein
MLSTFLLATARTFARAQQAWWEVVADACEDPAEPVGPGLALHSDTTVVGSDESDAARLGFVR